MFRENIFKKAKRHISQFWETEYWYRFRKIHRYWLDDDTGKWEKCVPQDHARDIITSTWEGEIDLLNHLLLKIDHMFWNLKKYGIEKDYYIYGSDILKYGSEKDKKIILISALQETLSNTDKIWLLRAETAKSKNGRCDFYLKYDNINFELIVYYNTYAYNDKSKTIIDKTVEILKLELPSLENIGNFAISKLDLILQSIMHSIEAENMVLLNTEQDFNLEDFLIESIDASLNYSFPLKDVCNFSKELRKHAVGNFVKCKDLLHLRRLIKNILKINDLDAKYNTWQDLKGEGAKEEIKKCRKLFMEDRKKAYKEMADFMAKKALCWWD